MSEEENKQNKYEGEEEDADIIPKQKRNEAVKQNEAAKQNKAAKQKISMDKAYMNKISIYAGVVMVFSILILIVITNVSADNGNRSKAGVAVVSTTVEPSQIPEPTEEPTPEPTKEPAVAASSGTAITPQPQTSAASTPVPVPTRTPKSRSEVAVNQPKPPIYQPPIKNYVVSQPAEPPKPTAPPTQRTITAEDFGMSAGKSGDKYIIKISAPKNKSYSYEFYARENNESAPVKIYPSNAGGNVYGWIPPKSDAVYEFIIYIYDGSKRIAVKRG